MPPTTVRNLQSGPTVFTDRTSDTAIEWQGKGDPSGGDIQQVPETVINNVNFMRALNNGILAIEEAEPAIQNALTKQAEAWQGRQDGHIQSSIDSIDQKAQNDLISVGCVGPTARGTGECGLPVPIKEKNLNDRPPLCPMHENLASQFVIEDTETVVEGKVVRKWARVVVAPRETQIT